MFKTALSFETHDVIKPEEYCDARKLLEAFRTAVTRSTCRKAWKVQACQVFWCVSAVLSFQNREFTLRFSKSMMCFILTRIATQEKCSKHSEPKALALFVKNHAGYRSYILFLEISKVLKFPRMPPAPGARSSIGNKPLSAQNRLYSVVLMSGKPSGAKQPRCAPLATCCKRISKTQIFWEFPKC